MPRDKKEDLQGEKEYGLSDFLETLPPNTQASLSGFVHTNPASTRGWKLAIPELRLFCNNDACNGYRFFSCNSDTLTMAPNTSDFSFLNYVCRNCRRTGRIYALWVRLLGQVPKAVGMKLGEWPEFGPPTPSRVISLVGPDRELFIKGRRCENQGLGIGAFGYFRRLVENQKDRILERILKVSEKLGADSAHLEELRAAKSETQFSKAVERVKHGIPKALLIDGHNPLLLLHNALSGGLHADSDEDCLELATSVRVVLTDLADRMGHALKDRNELS